MARIFTDCFFLLSFSFPTFFIIHHFIFPLFALLDLFGTRRFRIPRIAISCFKFRMMKSWGQNKGY
jgi:hypothetical protein